MDGVCLPPYHCTGNTVRLCVIRSFAPKCNAAEDDPVRGGILKYRARLLSLHSFIICPKPKKRVRNRISYSFFLPLFFSYFFLS